MSTSVDRARLARPEYTPGARDFPALFALVAEGDRDAERALARAGERALQGLAAAARADRALRAGAARLAARVGGDAARALARELLADDDARVRRAAATTLGKLGGPGAGEALAAAWDRALAAGDAAERRVLAEALGKVGGDAARERLARADAAGDERLAAILERARLTATRDATRVGAAGTATGVDFDTPPRRPLPVRLGCRAGLEELLVAELAGVSGARAARVAAPGVVAAQLVAAPSALHAARLWLDLAFPAGEVRGDDARDPVAAAAALLAGPAARAIFAAWTRGPWRFRVVWTGRGHRRADTWKLAAEVARRAPELVNDPRDAPWTARVAVDPGAARVTLELVPRRDADPRFAWRQGDVPAASHPTLAAALARVAGARPDDVVWDPFVGSGSELVERARLGPARALVGTDLDEQALAVAARNLAAAGVRAELVRADACAYRPSPAPTLVITNPPMGRRVARGELGPLLGRFVAHVAHVLAPGGRLVWLTPMPRVTDAAAARAGLVAERDHDVDMGGFSARLQVLRAPRRASAAR